MTTFVLVHGACHGGWSWDAVVAELERAGHTATAVDLPSDRPDLSLADDVAVVHQALDALTEPAVLVAHSVGAIPATAALAERQVAGLVFVAGVVPVPGKALADLEAQDGDRDGPLGEDDLTMFPDGTFLFTESAALRLLYPDCDPVVAKEAASRLRPQRSMWREVCTGSGWPDVPIRSIVCAEDRIVNPQWSRRIARERLGVEPLELAGSHSPMLSRPGDLAALLAHP
jgi:pimeloyl-ACP methyl ester carboxylesterase